MRKRTIWRLPAGESRVRNSDGTGVHVMDSKLRKSGGPAATAILFIAIVATSGCQQPTKAAASSPVPVHVVDVNLYSPSEDLRYSASVLPFAEAVLSFKSAGYVTEIKQIVAAHRRRPSTGSGDFCGR